MATLRAPLGRGRITRALRAFRLPRLLPRQRGRRTLRPHADLVRESNKPLARLAAEQVFSRVAGAPPIEGNSLRLLRDGAENYPVWLKPSPAPSTRSTSRTTLSTATRSAASSATRWLPARGLGVAVRVLYDWLGCLTRTKPGFWRTLRAGRRRGPLLQPPRLDSPFGWVSRNHRKTLTVDGKIGFVAGLCIGRAWVGDPAKRIPPWRDTGVEVRGPAIADLEAAFAQSWAYAGGAPIPPSPAMDGETALEGPAIALRVIGSRPNTMGLYRFDQLIAALARRSLWLTDAYFVGTTLYTQALIDAARDGVDVRLLVPGASDIFVAKALSRAGYRPLLEAGVRVFEWNGPMLHAKTAVADGRWARIGSTNLNLASWAGNWELDVAVEDAGFAQQMEAMFEDGPAKAPPKSCWPSAASTRAAPRGRGPRRGSPGRLAAGAVGLGSAVGAAITNHRALGPAEAKVMTAGGVILLALAVAALVVPRLVTIPLAVLAAWVATTLLVRAVRLGAGAAARSTKRHSS